MKDEDILPCPVCGRAAVHHTDVQRYNPSDWIRYVGCSNADCVQGPAHKDSDDASAAWNRLAQNEQLRQAVDKLQAKLDTAELTVWESSAGFSAAITPRQVMGPAPLQVVRSPESLADALIALGGQTNE